MFSYLASYRYYMNDIKASKALTYNPRTQAIKFSGPIPAFIYDGCYLYGDIEHQKQQLQEKFPGKFIQIVNQ